MINYFLFVVFAGNMQVVGPFHDLLACEKAASQARVAAHESSPLLLGPLPVGTTCMRQKNMAFKYKEGK